MSAPTKLDINLQVGRGRGLHLKVNGRPVEDAYGAIVMAELAALREFPDVRVDVAVRNRTRPTPAAMARLIAAELDKNEIWD